MPPSRNRRRSAAFARIKQEVLELTGQIPFGRVVSYADMGRILEVMPRHVAYILATLSPEEQAVIPWHRTISANGRLLTPTHRDRAARQAALLNQEGVAVTAAFEIQDLQRVLFPLA